MKIKNLFKLTRRFSIENPLSESEFRNRFVEKYIDTEKNKFKGKVENDILLLWRDRIVIKLPAYVILEIKLKNCNNSNLLFGEVKLTKLAKFIFLLSLLFVLIVILGYIFQNGFKFEIIVATIGIIAGGLIVIHSELNSAKNDYLAELKQFSI
jgi:hypothetical protein